MENQIEKKYTEIAQKLDNNVLSVIGSDKIQGFEKSYLVANAISSLSSLLTPEYMKPIMALQGNRLGFKTDKDKTGGYPEATVKNCLIEAVLLGLQPTGNQFNIIAGNMYPTKEGCGYLLNNFKGLNYDLVCSLPKINQDKTSAAIEVTISWSINGDVKERTIPIPLKMDMYTSVDALIGKATRKGRAWLLSRISGMEITDGDIQDIEYTDLSKNRNQKVEIPTITTDEIDSALKSVKTQDELNVLWKKLSVSQQLDYEVIFTDKEKEFIG